MAMVTIIITFISVTAITFVTVLFFTISYFMFEKLQLHNHNCPVLFIGLGAPPFSS